jgi:hypothetical protein
VPSGECGPINFPVGSTVILTAVANSGSTFRFFTGSACNGLSISPCPITVPSTSLTIAVDFSSNATAGTPAASVAPTSISFGSQQTNTTSAASSVAISNASVTLPLTINTVTLAGNADFQAVNIHACDGVVIAVGGNPCSIAFTFRPTVAASETATATINTNAQGAPPSVALSGTGTAAVTPTLTIVPLGTGSGTVQSGDGITVTNSNSYTTTFPLTENPISEGGIWSNGAAVGVGWSNVVTTGGHAIGTELANAPNTDSTAILNSATGIVQGTVFVAIPPSRSCGQEVDLRLRGNVSANSITGYEIAYSSSFGSLNIVRWNGPIGNFTVLATSVGSGASIRIDGSTDVDIIDGNLEEGGTQFINSNNDSGGGAGHPVRITNNHSAPAGCENLSNYWINTSNSAVPWYIESNSWDTDSSLVKLIGTNGSSGQAKIFTSANSYPNGTFNKWWTQGNTSFSLNDGIVQAPLFLAPRVLAGTIPASGTHEPSSFLDLRSYLAGSVTTLEDFALQDIPAGNSAAHGGTILFKHQQGTTGTSMFTFDGSYSGVKITGVTENPSAPGVNAVGTTGATTYTYSIVGYNAVGNTVGSATTSIANGNASLNSTNYNQITFSSLAGITKYCIWRTVGGATLGNIGCVSALATLSTSSYDTGFAANSSDNIYIFKDTGLTGDAAALPTLDSTGGFQLTSIIFANLPASSNGTLYYCSDCKNVGTDGATFDSVAANAGTGTTVLRENGAWRVH